MENANSYLQLVCARCKLATTRDVQSWSFGAITIHAPRSDAPWQSQTGSLDDQAIFGPITAYRCVCGKFVGQQHAGMICDNCGVKITSIEARFTRFGHINLSVPIAHEVCPGEREIEAFPVLPAALRLSTGGHKLNALYEAMLHQSKLGNANGIHAEYRKICDLLLPIIATAIEWNLKDAKLLAKGLALILQDSDRANAFSGQQR